MEVLPQVGDDFVPRQALQREAALLDALRDVLDEEVGQDDLARRQLVVLLLPVAVGAAFGPVAAVLGGRAEVVHHPDLGRGVGEVEGRARGHVSQEDADDVGVSIEREPGHGQRRKSGGGSWATTCRTGR